jgi:hypothetical protein
MSRADRNPWLAKMVEIRLPKKCSALYLQLDVYRAEHFFGSLISTRLYLGVCCIGFFYIYIQLDTRVSPLAAKERQLEEIKKIQKSF